MKLVFILASAVAALSAAAQVNQPSAPVHAVIDRQFGMATVDPYRWMEQGDPEFVSWLRAQDAYARSTLQALPARNELLARLTALEAGVDSVNFLQQAPSNVFFYLKNKKLFVREGLQGPERLLVDAPIDYFAPSLDGKYVAYSVSEGLRIVETGTGRNLADRIEQTRFTTVSWLPDNQSFFYARSNKTYLHTLGESPEKDRTIFNESVAAVTYAPGSAYLFAVGPRGVTNDVKILAAPLASLHRDPIPWQEITTEDDEVSGFAVRGSDIYLLTHHDAPRYKVVRTSLTKPDLDKAKTIIAPSDSLIVNIEVAKDALYAHLLDGGISKLKRVSYANNRGEEISLPARGNVNFLGVNPRFPGAFVNFGSWTQSPLWYRYTPETRQLRDTSLQAPSPVDFSDYESLEVKAKSADGTLIPLSIVLRKGAVRDGSHPTLLYAYGAYGISTLPSFEPKRLAWLERGGILAYAHVRGGGEYGEEWHRAGQKKMKMNGVDDLIACAQYLVEGRFTSPSKLAATGASAGGILIGRAITKRPDLFAAVVSRVSASNPMRMEWAEGAVQYRMEFGTVAIREEFEALRTMDPYLNVAPNTKYPAVLLTAAASDSRIPAWQQAKMAARLQAATISSKPILLRVDFEAGHGVGSIQPKEELADVYAFLLWQLAR
jgi:prolyl oligopeptidase